jgi:hypothetical protein
VFTAFLECLPSSGMQRFGPVSSEASQSRLSVRTGRWLLFETPVCWELGSADR